MTTEREEQETNIEPAAPVERLVMPACESCDYWKLGAEIDHGDSDLPYCVELRFWLNMMGTTYPHTPADFGCNKHSVFSE